MNMSFLEARDVVSPRKRDVTKNKEKVDFPVPFFRDGTESDGKLTKDVVWNFGYDDIVKLVKTFLVHFIRPLTLNMPLNQSVKDAVTGSDTIEFDHKGLLVDWRGELVYGPTTKDVTLTDYFWKKTCNGPQLFSQVTMRFFLTLTSNLMLKRLRFLQLRLTTHTVISFLRMPLFGSGSRMLLLSMETRLRLR